MTLTLNIISMLASKVALVTLGLIMAKFVTKRMKVKKLDRFLRKTHKQAAYTLLVSVTVHAVLSLYAFIAAPIAVFIAGFTSLLAMVAAIKTNVSRKTVGSKWKHLHRAAAVCAIIALALHLILRA